MHIQFKVKNLGDKQAVLTQLISRSTQTFALAALSAIAASTLIVYPPATLIPYEHVSCTIGEGAHQPKGIQVPLGSCVDMPFFKSYKATKPKSSDPYILDCSLYIYSGLGCTLDSFIATDLGEVSPKCYSATTFVTRTVGAKSALYTCEG